MGWIHDSFMSIQKNKEAKLKTRPYQPKIVCIGGGTGISTMLRGLKHMTNHVTAIITVADDGGSSGMLRNDLNIPPPGDIRNCILALAETEPIMEKLLQYRFEQGSLAGQNFGNLFLAAMTEITGGDFVTAVRQVSDVLKVTGRVLPVTATDVNLVATLENGKVVVGESQIGHAIHTYKSRIKKVCLVPKEAKDGIEIHPISEALRAIETADLITLGPGSLYTSVIPNLVVDGLADAIRKASAPVVYINNIMTQPGETNGYSAFDHVTAVLDHTYPDLIDYCIVNTGRVPNDLLFKYIEDGANTVKYDPTVFRTAGIKICEREMVQITADGLVRHNAEVLADAMLDILTVHLHGRAQVSEEGVTVYNMGDIKK